MQKESDWPESVKVISTADLEESPHLYSTHYRSIPGLWGMLRKAFPNHMTEALSAFTLAVSILSRTPALSSRITDRRAILFNLTCCILGYTDGQSTQTLILTEKAHAIRKNSCAIRASN